MVSTSEKYASSSLTDEKSLELFRTLERIMREEKIYKDNFITKDKVAEILGTNRTYLSRIINEQSKLSFTHYVNRFRIEEAIRLLSDPNNEIKTTPNYKELWNIITNSKVDMNIVMTTIMHRQDHRGNRQQDGTNIKQEHQQSRQKGQR